MTLIEEEVLKHLTEQVQLLSQGIVSDLEKAAEELQQEPQDLYGLSKYALMVRTLWHQTFITHSMDVVTLHVQNAVIILG